MKKTIVTKISSLLAVLSIAGSLSAAVSIWSEGFTGFAAGTDFTSGVGFYTLLWDGDNNSFWDPNTTAGTNNVRPLQYEGSETSFYWGAINAPISSETLKPQVGGNNDYKGAGVFFDSSVFTAGSGTYTLSYDIVGTDATSVGKSAGIQIATFTGIGADAANTAGFDVAGSTMFNDATTFTSVTDSRFRTQGSATLVNYVSQSVNTTIAGTFTLDFAYNQGEIVGLVFMGYATDVQFDNLAITAVPEPATFVLLAGITVLGLVMYRRRRA